ncbi:MAG: class I SAM-dependent methyltransferase [Spirochaetes bacterium]|nr:class I SAM-dependent methyltransferase [Spirochaetota bacterium]
MITPHTKPWYDMIAERQQRYFYPWKSKLPENHGEDSYVTIVKNEMKKSDVVLDVGCGSGEVTNRLAQYCGKIIGYDRVGTFIEQAKAGRHENAEFILHDSKTDEGIRLPGDGPYVDMFISSKGPLHWIPDAARIAKHGARILMLVPYQPVCFVWNDLLPMDVRCTGNSKSDIIRALQSRLDAAGIKIDDIAYYEVDEQFDEPEEFFKFIVWGKSDVQYSYTDLEPVIGEIFDRYGRSGILNVGYGRLIWKSHIP